MTDRGSVLLLALVCSCAVVPNALAQERWSVWAAGRDITALASPRATGNGIFIDIKGLAPVLGLVVEVCPDRIIIRAADGTVWSGRETGMVLRGPDREMALSAPIIGIGDAIYLEIGAAAQLSGLALRLRPAEQRAELVLPSPVEPDAPKDTIAPSPARAFRIPKTAAELAAGREFDPEEALVGSGALASMLPARHDVFSLGTAVGYVPGHDGATELTGGGRVHGIDADLNAFVTLGDRGPELYHGRLALRDQGATRALVIGDLVSETRGLSRGGTFSWRAGRGRTPAVSVYQPRFARGGDRTVVSYRDQFMFSRHLIGEGEVASDRSLVAKLRLTTDRVGAETYHHQGPLERDLGATAAVDLWRAVRVGGAARRSEGATLSERFEQAFLQVQLGKGASARFERSHVRVAANDNSTNAAVLTLPIGPVHVLARWQDRDLETFSQYGQARVAERGLLAAASYAPSARVKLNLQIANEWLQDGRVRDFQEVNANVQVTRSTAVQATAALTDVESIDRVRLRISQKLQRDLTVIAEVGRFSAFQAPLVAGDAFPSRFKIFLRKDWSVGTPARGGRVAGRVVDQIGTGVAGVVVRLGSYRTTTSRTGGYAFERVPRGTYALTLDPDHLPASYAARDADRKVTVRPGQDIAQHFVLAPLNAVHGRVYADRNENGQCDAGEELAGVVLKVADALTGSGTDGRYAFYNLAPGPYRVEVLTDRLPAEYELRTPQSFDVQLEAGRPAHAADVRLVVKRKPIVFQTAKGRS
jgi:hypothetical protein